MKREDKFGRPIHDAKVWNSMLEYGARLKDCGYAEAKSKPNLFYRKIQEAIFFVDMRMGDRQTEWAPLRYCPTIDMEDAINMIPLLYCRTILNAPLWMQTRLLNKERNKLEERNCPTRILDYYLYRNAEEYAHEDHTQKGREDGYCKACGKDFRDRGLFCSSACEFSYNLKKRLKYESRLPRCPVCGFKISSMVKHHISYSKNETIYVHPECHAKIHASKEYPILKPTEKRQKQPRMFKLVNCHSCSGKTQVPPDADETKPYYCCKCRKHMKSAMSNRYGAFKREYKGGYWLKDRDRIELENALRRQKHTWQFKEVR